MAHELLNFYLMKFCMNMYLDNLQNPIEFQGHRSKVQVTWVFVCVILWLPAGST